MRIDGVSSGRPAEKAGFIKGDIITKLGGSKIEDMMSYMKALENISKATIPLVNTIKKKTPKTPIIFVDHFDFSFSVLDNHVMRDINSMNRALKTEFDKMVDDGYENIFYLESKNALGSDYEGTVDGVHFTDLGFIRYADFLMKKFKELKLID